MAVDIRSTLGPIGPSIPLSTEESPEFSEVVKAQLGYSYQPVIDALSNSRFLDIEFDPEYDPRPDIVGYEDYFDTLVHAKNAEHMSVLKDQLDKNAERRQTMADAGFWTNVGAGFLDPVNYVSLPFGGPSVGILRSAGRGALAAGATQAGLETLRAPFDPMGTTSEIAVNIGATAVFGALINGAVSIPMSRRADAFRRTEQSHKEFMEAAGVSEDVSRLSPDDVLNKLPRDERAFAAATDDDIRVAIESEEGNVFGAETRLKELNELDQSRMSVEEMENISNETASLLANINKSEATISVNKHERALRSIEDAAGVADNYDIASNIFIDSPFFKVVTTPLKRVLQSDIANVGKSAMLKLGHDSGLTLAMNKFAISTGPSTYQRAAIMEGEWVQANSALTDIWSKTLGFEQGARRPLGINVADIVERGSKIRTGEDRTYGTWLREVGRKRVNGLEPSDEMEGQAIEIMNKFYKRWEDRLEEVGLLGSRKNLEETVKRQEYRLNEVTQKLDNWEKLMREGKLASWEKKNKRPAADVRDMYEAKILRLNDSIEENRMSIDSLADQTIRPANEDVFMPRYWDTNKIRKNRAELEKIIADWYKGNPVVYKKEGGKFRRVELDPSDEATAARAKETVDGILGLKDTLHPENIAYGFGKSKHLRHRELDIPNRLVYDFIVQDPIAIMKAYTHRTAGVYQFKKMFGNRSVADVLDDLEEEMILAGNSQKEINAYRRDFAHMYDRIVGSPVHNFDRIDFKAAQMVKDLAYMNYLGSAGFSAISDFSRIIMEHEMGDVLKGLATILERDKMKLSIEETNLLGEAIDIIKGSAHIRQTDNMTNNPLQNTAWDTARNVYNVANLLGPMTQIAKEFDGLLRGHMLIKLSKQWVDGSISQKDATYLARYGITRELAEVYAKAPVQQTKSGLYIANTSAWTDTIQFPDTTAKIITGPTNSYNGNRYKPAFYRESENAIYIDEDYIRDVMYPEGWWKNPRFEGIRGISEDIIRNADDLVTFVKMHEILHTKYRPEDLGIIGTEVKQKEFVVSVRAAGFEFNRTYKSAKQLQKELDFLEVELARQGELMTALRDAGADPLDNEFLFASYEHNFAIIEKLKSLQKSKDYKQQLKIEESGKTPRELTNEQAVAYENAINDFTIDHLKNQTRIRAEDTETFRTAMQSGILNTVMMGTPADRPIITDGVVYVPYRIAKTFGYEEDSLVKGYSRVESGILGLPFQFYSYSLAAMNKVTAAYTQGQIKNPMTGVVAAMGLGYLAVQIKTPDWAWEQMEWSDRFARSFDQSGLLALYSDLLYSSINTSMALGYDNYMEGIISPKFPQEEDYVDAATGLLGAGPSIAVDLTVNPMASFINGEAGEGMKTFIRNLPFMRVWLWKDQMNAMTRGLEDLF
jgi:hypothetical protein